MSRDLWRVGTKVPINVYEGDRSVCQCHNEADAARIVDAVNMAGRIERARASMFTELAQDSAGICRSLGPNRILCAMPRFHKGDRHGGDAIWPQVSRS